MATDPLLKSESLDRRRSSESLTGAPKSVQHSLDRIVQNMESVQNLDELLSYVTNVSRWSTMKHESRHHAYISQLKRALDIMNECQSLMQNSPIYKTLTLLSNLEQTMSSSRQDDLMMQLLKLFAADVDQHLDPVPTNDMMKRLAEGLADLQGQQLVIPGGSGETLGYHMWGQAVLFPNRERVKEIKPKLDEAEAAFSRSVMEAFNLMMEGLGQGGGIIKEYFGYVFDHCISAGQYGWLDNASILRACHQEHKSCFHWSAMGPVLDILVERHALTVKELVVDSPSHRFPLQAVATVIMPRFTHKLSALLSILESQVKEVDNLKSKILAVGMSAAITGGQLMMNLAMNYANHLEGSGSGNSTVP